MAQVVLDGVTKAYPGDVVAVQDFSLTIANRERVVVVGPSGCGKTTTLRLIAGLDETTRGTISMDGQLVNGWPPQDRDVAMVSQNYALYPQMSVFENLAFGLRLRRRRLGLSRSEMERCVREMADTLGLIRLLDRMPRQLSGGERQRVAIGRAIVRQPQTILMDEPLSGIDPPLRAQLRREIAELHDRIGVSMLYVTHDQSEAMSLGCRIVVLDRGIVQQIGTPVELYESPANRFVGGFIGMPPMNFLEGRLKDNGGGMRFEDGEISLALPPEKRADYSGYLNQEVVLGLRPEDVSCGNSGPNAPFRQMITGRATAVEFCGNEKIVHAESGRQRVACRVDARLVIERDERVELAFDMRRSHVFDKTGGLNITRVTEKGSPGG